MTKAPVHPYPNAFENASTRSVCESFSPVHTKTRKRYPLLSMRHATMYVNDVFLVYDIIVFETSIFVRPHEKEKPAFSKLSTLESVCEKMSFRWPFSADTCGPDGRLNGRKKYISVFKHINWYVWTGNWYVGKEINLLLLPLGLLALNYQSPSSTNCVKWKKRQIFNNYWMRLSIL